MRLIIERDHDCACRRWKRWRLVEIEDVIEDDLRMIHERVVAYTVTMLGARLKRRRLGVRLPGLFRT